MKYSTFHDHPGIEALYNDDGIKFSISELGCGIEIDSLDFDMHDGDWKCHIADTDKNSSHVKVEAETMVNVAQESSRVIL